MKNRRNLVLILAFLKVRAFTFDGEYGIVKKCAVREYPKSWIGDIRQRDERAALKFLMQQVGDRLH